MRQPPFPRQNPANAPEGGLTGSAPEAAPRADDAITERLRELSETVGQGFCVIQVIFDAQRRPVDYLFLEVNDAFERQSGLENAVGRTMRELRPEHEEYWFRIYGDVALTGEPTHVENSAKTLQRWFDVYAFPVGVPSEYKVAVLFTDITARRKQEDLFRLRIADREHRVKNVLTLVTAIVRLTRAESVDDFKELVLGRIGALMSSQSIEADGGDSPLPLDALVKAEAGAYEPERFKFSGPAVSLPPAAAQCVAMTVHELSTNAAKYGALSVAGGSVSLTWSVEPDRKLRLHWVESGGPATRRPERSGTGTAIIQGCVCGQLRGDVDYDWRADGLTCEIAIPLEA